MPKTTQSRLFFALIVTVLVCIIGRNLYRRSLRRSLDDALIAAVEAKNVARTRALLDSGVDANIRKPDAVPSRPGHPLLSLVIGPYKGEEPTEAANMLPAQEIACLLIGHGARVEDDPMGYHSYLQDACGSGSVPVARCLLEHGASAEYGSMYSNAPMRHVVEYAQYASRINGAKYAPAGEQKALRQRVSRDIINLLRQHGARLTALDAARLKDADLLREVLGLRASVNEQERSGTTALGAATQQGDLLLMQILLAHGANVGMEDSGGSSPLSIALEHRQKDSGVAAVKLLLAHGANPNVIAQGVTPLLIAVQTDNADMTRLLLARGANPGLRPPRSHTALYYARRHKNAAIIQLLERTGAKEE